MSTIDPSFSKLAADCATSPNPPVALMFGIMRFSPYDGDERQQGGEKNGGVKGRCVLQTDSE